jgi:hypothetical protein
MEPINRNVLKWTRLAIAVCMVGMIVMLAGCGVQGYQTVMNRVVVPGGATQSVHVDCPAGKKVLGGGFSIETPDEVKVFHSEPSDGHGNLVDNGWDVMVHNIDSQGRQTTAVAICAQ